MNRLPRPIWTRCAAAAAICATCIEADEMSETKAPPSRNEAIKADSNFLRGTIAEGLAQSATGALSEHDTQLTKFHGIYQQDDRDLRAERGKKKMEKAFIFMARLRVPGGIMTPSQWLAMEEVAKQ